MNCLELYIFKSSILLHMNKDTCSVILSSTQTVFPCLYPLYDPEIYLLTHNTIFSKTLTFYPLTHNEWAFVVYFQILYFIVLLHAFIYLLCWVNQTHDFKSSYSSKKKKKINSVKYSWKGMHIWQNYPEELRRASSKKQAWVGVYLTEVREEFSRDSFTYSKTLTWHLVCARMVLANEDKRAPKTTTIIT